MTNIKYFFQKNKMLIIIAGIILVCSIAIAIGVYAQITNKNVIGGSQEEYADYEELESNFEDIFSNSINKEATAKMDINYDDYIYCRYDIQEEKDGYKINAKIPMFKIETETTKGINQEIYNTFATKIIDIVNNSVTSTIYELSYVAYINNNIISLVINCKYKDGANPQRNIIQTYNYDIDNDKLLTIQDILNYKNLNKSDVQNKITEKITGINNQLKGLNSQGYNVYQRNENDEMYIVDNTPNFFLGKNNYLYLVYAYGNKNYTTEMDLVIF